MKACPKGGSRPTGPTINEGTNPKKTSRFHFKEIRWIIIVKELYYNSNLYKVNNGHVAQGQDINRDLITNDNQHKQVDFGKIQHFISHFQTAHDPGPNKYMFDR